MSKTEGKQKAIKNVIVIERGEQMECWGSLTEICKVYVYNYNTMSKKKFPFEHNKWSFRKIPFREKSIKKAVE